MPKAYLGIGTNIGDLKDNIHKALSLLEQSGISVLKTSSLHETEPWGVTGQPPFLNAAVEVETSLEPGGLLSELKGIERRMGRFFDPSKWGPRIMDLDILFYDDDTIDNKELKVPHPLIEQRAFVLEPLCEIAPLLVHPVTGKTVSAMLEELRAAGQ